MAEWDCQAAEWDCQPVEEILPAFERRCIRAGGRPSMSPDQPPHAAHGVTALPSVRWDERLAVRRPGRR